MSRLTPWLITVGAVVFATLLLFYSRDISKFIVGPFLPQQQDKTSTIVVATVATIAKDTSSATDATAEKDNQNQENDLKKVRELHHLDEISTPSDKPLRLIFTSGWVIDLKENSSAIVELYRPGETDSPALLSLITGEYALVTPGPLGQLFIMSDKKIYSPQNAPPQQVRTIEITEPGATVKSSVEATVQSTIELPVNGVSAHGRVASKLPDKIINQDNTETLSNNYIEQVLAGQSNSLRNCQLNSVRDRMPARGKLILTFTINPDGKIAGVKILQDKIKNKQLAKCVVAVIERTNFKPYTGAAISLSYPLEFK